MEFINLTILSNIRKSLYSVGMTGCEVTINESHRECIKTENFKGDRFDIRLSINCYRPLIQEASEKAPLQNEDIGPSNEIECIQTNNDDQRDNSQNEQDNNLQYMKVSITDQITCSLCGVYNPFIFYKTHIQCKKTILCSNCYGIDEPECNFCNTFICEEDLCFIAQKETKCDPCVMCSSTEEGVRQYYYLECRHPVCTKCTLADKKNNPCQICCSECV
jgi:hypothetical protein